MYKVYIYIPACLLSLTQEVRTIAVIPAVKVCN